MPASWMPGLPGWLRSRCPVPWAALAVAVWVFLAPNFDFAFALTWHDGQRLAQLGLFVAVLLTLAVPGAAPRVMAIWVGMPGVIRYALWTAFALGLLSSFVAALPRWALLDWGWLLLLLVLGLCIAANRRVLDDRVDAGLVWLFFATAAAYAVTACSVYVAMLWVGPAYDLGFDIRELYTRFSNVRFFGHVQTMVLPFLLLPALCWGMTRARCLLWWSVPAIWWLLAVGSGTRGTWAALLAGGVAAVLFGGPAGRRWARWQVVGLGVGLLGYGLFIWGIPQWMDRPTAFLHRADDLLSLSNREVLWTTALDYVMQQPWLGVGPMHYAYWATAVAAHPHNAVLQWLAEWGIPAGLLLTGVWAAGGLSFANHVRRGSESGAEPARLFRVALLAALTGAAAQAMVDGVLVMPVSQVLLALLAGWALGMMPGTADACVVGRGGKCLLVLVVLCAVAAVVYGVAPDIGQLAERQQVFFTGRDPNTPLLPRFWALGWIRP